MYQYKAKIVRVIDGDSLVMDIDLGFYVWLRRVHVRLAGIDTPEKSDLAGWTKSKEFVDDFFGNNPEVTIEVYKLDNFGRWLADVFEPQGTTLNQNLLSTGLAKPFVR